MSGGLKTEARLKHLGVEFKCPHATHECEELIDKIEILLYSTSNSTLTVIRILHNSIDIYQSKGYSKE